jgi:hypothetical protein
LSVPVLNKHLSAAISVKFILTCSSLLYAHLHKILKQRIPHLFNLKMLKHKEKRNTSNCVFGLCQIINENWWFFGQEMTVYSR